MHAPFHDPRVVAVFEHESWESLNRPVQKRPLREAFPEIAHLPRHSNLQLGDSGIAETIGRAALRLDAHARSPVKVYNALARGAL
jgi:hypothetical protein